MKNKLFAVFILFTAIYGYAQENRTSFTLNEAISFALENNYNVINAKRDIEAAEKQKWETTTIGLPQISASIDYQNFLKQPVSLLPAAAFDPLGGIRQLEDYYDLDALQTQELPNAPEGFIPVTFGTKQSVNATATLTQLIFDGSYLVGLQSAKVFLEISKNAKEKTDLEIRKAVINAYGNVLLAQESISIIEKNKTTLEKNLTETQKIFENGLTEEENVEQLQITLANVDNSLKNARRMLRIARQMLNITLGLDIHTNITLTDDLTGLTDQNIDPALLTVQDAVENNIDYKIASNNKRSQELLLKLEKSKALPTLSAFVNGGYTGNNDQFRFLNSDQQWFGSSVFGVSLKVPVFSSLGRSASTQRAKINLEKAETELTQTEQQLRLQIASAKSDYEFAIAQYETAKQNLALAERIEQKNQTKFFEGISSSFDLRQAQTQLYSSQQEYLQSMLDVITKKSDLETLISNIPSN